MLQLTAGAAMVRDAAMAGAAVGQVKGLRQKTRATTWQRTSNPGAQRKAGAGVAARAGAADSGQTLVTQGTGRQPLLRSVWTHQLTPPGCAVAVPDASARSTGGM